ncbi:MAG: Protein translocase subunit SecA [Phycisphaerae bacterium]|nr:Protein translocase subunit SecA [Phycisphaerae bacterium]
MILSQMDVLRDATSPWTVFYHTARRSWMKVGIALLLTALLTVNAALIVTGGDGWVTREQLAGALSFMGVVWLAYCGWLTFGLLPSRSDRVVIDLRRQVRAEVDPLEQAVVALDEAALRAKTDEFKARFAGGESIDSIRPEAYACVREASRRARNHRQFECQLIGAKVLERCNVAEMRTGEGKTIVCYPANYLKVIQGLKVHMVTVNDYLVKRDAEFCRPIFELLGVSVGFISADMDTFGAGAETRRAAYACDITYGTNSEFGFDYLRDNMKHHIDDQVQGRLDYVVVDEVDSILIDEARTPLIISGPAHDDVSNYRVADNIARMLIAKQEAANRATAARIDELENNPPPESKGDPKFKSGLKKFRADPFWLSSDEAEAIGHMQYFVVEIDRKSAHMTEHGAKAAQQELAIGTFYDSKNMNWPHYIDNALRAHVVYQKDKEYVIQDDQIIIVDEFTGRLMHGRQWSDGLHQAVEAKERVTIKQETQTLATITLQNFFKLYKQLCGMTGTAMTESDEFMKIYKLEVIAIPTNQPIRRADFNDKIYKTTANKYEAIVEEIRSYSQNGYPADPWSLADMLKTRRRELREQASADGAAAQISEIDAALKTFKDGEGPSEALEKVIAEQFAGKLGGRPILVGTTSVENSEKLSNELTRRFGIDHEVLNAKNHAREAEIVAKAGQRHEIVRGRQKMLCGNVTIATNMAGRGTDIVLGPGVADLGGLHVVGTERHESRRIDNQLRGRCGRQGDLGSSRFFLSLEDDLLRIFMGEWALKMLQLLGFEEGMSIENRRLTKGIERAQKKVEERNFGIRKNLLEYDEVMDYQRRSFYGMRQRVVESRGLAELTWEMIDQTVADAVARYFDRDFVRSCVGEWVGQKLEIAISTDKLDTTDLRALSEQVRSQAADEARSSIQRTFGEYVDPDVDPDEWDLRGLASWAARFGLNLTHAQIKKADPGELQEQITEAAIRKIDGEDLSGLEQFVDPGFARAKLAKWAFDKFDLPVPVDELSAATREDSEQRLREKIRAAYRRREIEYPPHVAIEFAAQRGGSNANEICAGIAQWANSKYNLNYTYEHFLNRAPDDVFHELRAQQEEFLANGKLEAEIDAALSSHGNNGVLDWARQRFGPLAARITAAPGDGLRDELLSVGREMLCFELRQLERYILLSIYDQAWKDHMYAMDLLRHGISLRGYAERDPKIEYKREGTRMFNEMMSAIRERVTDLIFKARISVAPPGARPAARTAGPRMTTQKADATGAGFQSAQADQDAAMRKQGEGAKVDPIRRSMPRVGRNDPCPCGSGKKYKQCHGKGQAS